MSGELATTSTQAPGRLGEIGVRLEAWAETRQAPVDCIESVGGRSTMVIVVGAGSELRLDGVVAHAFCAGLAALPVITSHGGRLRCVEITAPAELCSALWPGLGEAAQPIDVAEVWRGTPLESMRRAQEARDWTTCLERLGSAITAQLALAAPVRAEARSACQLLSRSHGRMGKAALAAAFGRSERHMIGVVRDAAGVTPKTLARRLHFAHARRLLEGPGPLSEIAETAGYSDQSHLTREHLLFGGCTPGRHRAGSRSELVAPISLLQDIDACP